MKKLMLLFNILIISIFANCYYVMAHFNIYWFLLLVLPIFVYINIFPANSGYKNLTFRLKICDCGTYLLISFISSLSVSLIYHIFLAFKLLPSDWKTFVFSIITVAVVEGIVFWNGIIRVYCTSLQLGIKKRIIGIICGWIPILHIIMLYDIVRTTRREVIEEYKKAETDLSRKAEQICKTRYPVLLVHGVFFRDVALLNYWGRIPGELKKNGATIYYGEHDSAASVAKSGAELTEKIKKIVEETNCGKVNIIAHSKGGLDSRYAISVAGAAPFVASLTTVNTPHRGCLFADYLLNKIPQSMQNKIAESYNAAMRNLGDNEPDFMAAVHDLTEEKCRKLNDEMPDINGIYYRSVGSKLKRATGGKFPLNYTYHIAKHFSGDNDGLVSLDSCKWGEDFISLTPKGKCGISHGDIIDLNRQNIPDFDVREFYVTLVSELKDRGL